MACFSLWSEVSGEVLGSQLLWVPPPGLGCQELLAHLEKATLSFIIFYTSTACSILPMGGKLEARVAQSNNQLLPGIKAEQYNSKVPVAVQKQREKDVMVWTTREIRGDSLS